MATVEGVVVVVVVPAVRIGEGGGGADTTWDVGSATQPETRQKAPQTKTGRSRVLARLEVEAIKKREMFISITEGCSRSLGAGMGYSPYLNINNRTPDGVEEFFCPVIRLWGSFLITFGPRHHMRIGNSLRRPLKRRHGNVSPAAGAPKAGKDPMA